jgi:hypothetical protein
MDKRIIKGSEGFAAEVGRTYELESVTKPKGRPRKGAEKRRLERRQK